MDINKAYKTTIEKLKLQLFIDQPQLEADLLLVEAIDRSKEFIISNPNKNISKKEETTLNKLIKRRLKGEPIAYILGNQEFYKLDFLVNKDVLIPRPETEILVDSALEIIKKSNKEKVEVIDIGTGSGCIPIAIAKNLPKNKEVKISASDISNKSLAIARQNAKKHQVALNFINSNLLDNINSSFDIITANLPYIESDEAKPIARLLHHPLLSLDGGKRGLDLIRELLSQSVDHIQPNSTIILEIAPDQKEELIRYVKTLFNKPKIKVIKDLADIDRVVIITIDKK
jgi:release factor glutamine methyltransferase